MSTPRRVALFLLAASFASAAAPAEARQRQDPLPPSSERRADFLFGRPTGALGVRGSWVFASAGSDLFDFVTNHLTLERDDFNAPGFGVDVAVSVHPRLDVQGGFEMSRVNRGSEYRRLVDNNLQPIEQQTALRTAHVFGSLRYSLVPRGHQVSRLAWVPQRFVPFVGAGAGAVHYRFEQQGDFVDFVDNSIFFDVFRSRGWAPSAHVMGGVDIQLHRALFATVQGRYTKASATLDSDFVDFDPIDLSGLRLSAGISVLF